MQINTIEDHISTISGVNIVVAKEYPKMNLSDGAPVTSLFRTEFDAWLMSFFGTTNYLPPDGYLVVGTAMYVSEKQYKQLKENGKHGN